MRRLFPILLAVMFLISPLVVFADPWYSDPSFTSTGLVPCSGPECQACHVVKLGQNIINFFVMIAAFIAVIIFCYAGFLMLTAGGEMGKVTQARAMFTNVVVGLVIVLAGWLIIDTVMKWAFQPNSATDEGSPLYKAMKNNFGPWNQINCVAPVQLTGPAAPPAGGVTPGTTGKGTGAGAQCDPANPACSPTALQAAGYIDPQVANAMSCIAMTESAGNPNGPNSPTGACGTLQITQGNWRNPALHQGNCSSSTSCNDATCNLQTAYLLSKVNVSAGASPYQPWTCNGCNASAQACIDKYDPGGNSRRTI